MSNSENQQFHALETAVALFMSLKLLLHHVTHPIDLVDELRMLVFHKNLVKINGAALSGILNFLEFSTCEENVIPCLLNNSYLPLKHAQMLSNAVLPVL